MTWPAATEGRVQEALREAAHPREPDEGTEPRVLRTVARKHRQNVLIAAGVVTATVVSAAVIGTDLVQDTLSRRLTEVATRTIAASGTPSPSPTEEDDVLPAWGRALSPLPRGRTVELQPRLQLHGDGRWQLAAAGKVVTLAGEPLDEPSFDSSWLVRSGSTTLTVVLDPARRPMVQVVTPTSSTTRPLLAAGAAPESTGGEAPQAELDATGQWFVVSMPGKESSSVRVGRVAEAPEGRKVVIPGRTPQHPTWPLTESMPVAMLPNGEAVVNATYQNPSAGVDPDPSAPATDSTEVDAEDVAYAVTRTGVRVLAQGSAERIGGDILFSVTAPDGTHCVRRVAVPDAADPDAIAGSDCSTSVDRSDRLRSPSSRHTAVLARNVRGNRSSSGLADIVHVDGRVAAQVAAGGGEWIVWEDDDHLLVVQSELPQTPVDAIRVDVRTGAMERAPMPPHIRTIRW